jgi:Lrp/AsnC family leucine-responsive transcriptional regulator
MGHAMEQSLMAFPTLDGLDLRILELLQDNARIAQADIARDVGLAPSAVLERLRKLESRGVIQGYAVRIDPRALDQRLLAFVAVRTTDRPGEAQAALSLAEVPEVLEVHHVAGDDCLLLKVRARDPEHLSQILRERLGRVEGVRSTRTTIVLETIKESTRLPIGPAAGTEASS